MIKTSKLPLILAFSALAFMIAGLIVWQTARQNKEEVTIIENQKPQNQKTQISRSQDSKENFQIPAKGGQANSDFQTENVLGEEEVGKLSVNEATEEELDTVPGVGAATIKKIIDGRPWENLEDALNLINKRWREEARGKLKL